VKARNSYLNSNVGEKEKKIKHIQAVINNLETSGFQTSVVEQFGAECCISNEDFQELINKQRNIIAFQNGVYELESGTFREGEASDYLTMRVPYEYDPVKMFGDEASIAEFNDFYFKVFPDREVAKWVIKYLGSCLAGFTQDQIFVFGHGNGSNGKGVLINLMTAVLGSFAGRMDAAFLCGGMPDPEKPTTTLTRLANKRFVYLSETLDGAKLNEQLFKCLCGEEIMVIRPMYGEQQEFMPEFKFLMVCNSLPSFNGSDYAMKRRIRVIPFESTFVDAEEGIDESKKRYLKDKSIGQRLNKWKYAVMGILLRSYELYLDEGLDKVPEAMEKYTESYVNENDKVKQFVEECIEFGDGRRPEFKTLTGDVYPRFVKFGGTGTEKVTCQKLVKEFGSRAEYRESKCAEKWGRITKRFFEGLKLRDEGGGFGMEE